MCHSATGIGAFLTASLLIGSVGSQEPEKREERFTGEQEYRERMHEIRHSFESLEKHRGLPIPPEAEEEANKLAELFAEVESFWEGRGDEEAANAAGLAKEGAEAAEEAARDGNREALETAIDTVADSCEGCHRQPLDKYRIK